MTHLVESLTTSFVGGFAVLFVTLFGAFIAIFSIKTKDPMTTPPTPEPEPIKEPEPVIVPPVPPPPITASQLIYEKAKQYLNHHLELNPAVPPDLGCAESLSYVLIKAGIKGLPIKGFEGTARMNDWLKTVATRVSNPQPGDIIMSPTGMSSKSAPHGHCGVVGLYGILSNDSNSGLWSEEYTEESWQSLYGNKLGFPIHFYRFS